MPVIKRFSHARSIGLNVLPPHLARVSADADTIANISIYPDGENALRVNLNLAEATALVAEVQKLIDAAPPANAWEMYLSLPVGAKFSTAGGTYKYTKPASDDDNFTDWSGKRIYSSPNRMRYWWLKESVSHIEKFVEPPVPSFLEQFNALAIGDHASVHNAELRRTSRILKVSDEEYFVYANGRTVAAADVSDHGHLTLTKED